MDRMSRAQFVEVTAALDRDRLAQVLWTLYWRGPQTVRSRIEAEISSDPAARGTRAATSAAGGRDPAQVFAAVDEFVELVRSGAYFAGSRRVSPKQRTRWRFVYKDLVEQTRDLLTEHRLEDGAVSPRAAQAMEALIDLACLLSGHDYVRSQDPVAASGVVVSDEVAVLWAHLLRQGGIERFAPVAVAQLLRWESAYGWTRRGEGAVAGRETTLAQVLEELVTAPAAWEVLAEHYLDTIDAPTRGSASERARRMSAWHEVLAAHLTGGGAQTLVDRLAARRRSNRDEVGTQTRRSR